MLGVSGRRGNWRRYIYIYVVRAILSLFKKVLKCPSKKANKPTYAKKKKFRFYNKPMAVSNTARAGKTKELGARESAPLLDPGTGRKCAESLFCCSRFS